MRYPTVGNYSATIQVLKNGNPMIDSISNISKTVSLVNTRVPVSLTFNGENKCCQRIDKKNIQNCIYIKTLLLKIYF